MISKHHHPHVCPSNDKEMNFYYGIFTIKYIWFFKILWLKNGQIKIESENIWKKTKTWDRSQTVSITIKFKLTKVLLHLAWLDSPGIWRILILMLNIKSWDRCLVMRKMIRYLIQMKLILKRASVQHRFIKVIYFL